MLLSIPMSQSYPAHVTPLGIDPPPRPPSARRHHRAVPQGPGVKVQLREDDLPKVLRQTTAASDQLQEKEVRTHQPAATEEEDKVMVCLGVGWRWRETDVTMARLCESGGREGAVPALNGGHTRGIARASTAWLNEMTLNATDHKHLP